MRWRKNRISCVNISTEWTHTTKYVNINTHFTNIKPYQYKSSHYSVNNLINQVYIGRSNVYCRENETCVINDKYFQIDGLQCDGVCYLINTTVLLIKTIYHYCLFFALLIIIYNQNWKCITHYCYVS